MAEDKKKDEIAVIEINEEFMKQKLYEFRGCKVLLDADLAEVYGYELKAFNQQVKRNIGNYSAPRLGYINFWSKQRKYNFCFIIALLRKVDNFSM